MDSPSDILESALQQVRERVDQPILSDADLLDKVQYVARCLSNRAGARMLITCALAKIYRPTIDIRKPYTEIEGNDAYSGRAEFDEPYVWPFAARHDLPLNATTAFLTPGFRTINVPLARSLVISGRPKRMYADVIDLLEVVHQGAITADDLLAETLRQLLLLKREQEARMQQLLAALSTSDSGIALSSEEIINLIEQHLSSPKASRLPVLIVVAAYRTALLHLGEQARPLYAHTAADLQTGALGDVEITLVGDDEVVTSYEMKAKDVTKEDIDLAVRKLAHAGVRLDNYIFITTGRIMQEVADYAASLYLATGGVEFTILDCISFLRHFLHLFHRLRLEFLEAYQALVLAEPESAINQPLKEAFLALRRAAEMDRGN